MAFMNFADQLAQAKRRAKLSGRPISQQELAGITEGYASGAADRVAKAKNLALMEEGQETQKEQFGQTLALTREQNAQRAMEFEKTYGLSMEQARAQAEQFEATFGLSVQQAMNANSYNMGQLALATQNAADARSQFEKNYALQVSSDAAQRAAASDAMASQKKTATIGAVGAGAMIGGYAAAGTTVGGPWGAVIGAGVGFLASLFL